MNKREALQAMLDGKKITHVDKSGLLYKYIYMYIDTDGVLRYDDGTDGGGFLAEHIINTGWEIYEEPKEKVKYYSPRFMKIKKNIVQYHDENYGPFGSHLWFESKEKAEKFYDRYDVIIWEEVEVEK